MLPEIQRYSMTGIWKRLVKPWLRSRKQVEPGLVSSLQKQIEEEGEFKVNFILRTQQFCPLSQPTFTVRHQATVWYVFSTLLVSVGANMDRKCNEIAILCEESVTVFVKLKSNYLLVCAFSVCFPVRMMRMIPS